MKGNNFVGTGKLLRLFLRRDRFILPVWIFLSMMAVDGQIKFVSVMPNWQEFIRELTVNPLVTAWLGPIVPLTIEGAIIRRGILQAALVIMLGSAFTVIRHTRTEEEFGRSELFLSRAVGRYANLSAALLLSCIGSLVAGILVFTVLVGGGLAVSGSLIAGLTSAAFGWAFAGIGGLAAQFRENGGRARGLVFAVYAATFVPMVVNNVGGGNTRWAWIVPQSWFRITLPFGDNNIWPLLVFVILSAIPITLAYYLASHRDMGSGLFPQKLGVAEGSPRLNSPLALAWIQHKGTILAWTIGMAFIGGAIGIVTPNISDNISEMLVSMNTWAETMAELGNKEGFMAVSIYILGLMAGMSVYGIITVLKLKEEETEHFAEILLAKSVSRKQWMSSYLIMAFAGSIFILLVLGVAAGLGWSIAAGDISLLPRVLIMSLTKAPAVWVFIGITALLYGWFPRISGIFSWCILGSFIIIEMLWEAGIVGWSALQLTPFAYVHYSIPINKLSIFPLLMLILLSLILSGIGMVGLKRRSIGL